NPPPGVLRRIAEVTGIPTEWLGLASSPMQPDRVANRRPSQEFMGLFGEMGLAVGGMAGYAPRHAGRGARLQHLRLYLTKRHILALFISGWKGICPPTNSGRA